MRPDHFSEHSLNAIKQPIDVGLPTEPDPLLDSEQAARRLKIHPKTLQRYARQGYVHGFQIGTMWRFRSSDIDNWIAQQAS